MKLIIDIDKDDYEYMKNGYVPSTFNIFSIIKNGTLLPKGHGRLIDADKLLVHKMYGIFGKVGYKTEAVYVDDINDAQTIIEADDTVTEVVLL